MHMCSEISLYENVFVWHTHSDVCTTEDDIDQTLLPFIDVIQFVWQTICYISPQISVNQIWTVENI